MVQETLATRLRVLRARRGLSLTEAGELAGIQRQTLAKLERGQRERPHDTTLAKIAQAYAVPVEDLLEEPPVLLGKAEAPDTGQSQTPTGTVEEFKRKMAHFLEPSRTEALRDAQAIARLVESGGIPQHSGRAVAEAEARKRFSDAFSGEEKVEAVGALAYEYALLERACVMAQKALRERDEKLAERSEKIAQLEAEIERLKEENAESTSEAEREGSRH
jgi:transcriptional regulator with XRE-family HTH domain